MSVVDTGILIPSIVLAIMAISILAKEWEKHERRASHNHSRHRHHRHA